jgi:ketosteroid isomerase-like protein
MYLSLRSLSLFALFSFSAAALTPFVSSSPANSQGDALSAEHLLTSAISKGDQASIDKLLDPEFSWTDRFGKTLTKPELLPVLASLAPDKDTDVKVMAAGNIALIHGTHRILAENAAVRFVRVWVKHSQGWQLLVYQETNKADRNPEKRAGFGAPSNGAPVNCENPCKSVPYKPDTGPEQEVVAMWQAVERTVLTNDVEAWVPNFTEDFIFVTPDGGTPLNKADRIAMITELRRTNTTLIPAEVVSMKVWVLGDSAVMRSEHKPMHGKVMHVTRLFEKHGGHWQIAFGQQTWIE